MNLKRGVTLRFIISALVVMAVLLTILTSVLSALQVFRDSLTSSYLLNNYQYARKLSLTTHNLLESMHESMKVLADKADLQSIDELQDDLDMFMKSRKDLFNTAVIVDTNEVVRAFSSVSATIFKGYKLTSEAARKANLEKRPLISEPYRGATGNLMILVSVPIYDKSGVYAGFVGGTMYLDKNNALSNVLNEHDYNNGSYAFVVDHSGRIIFHPEQQRLYDNVKGNPMIQKALAGKSGYEQVINSQGKPFFAGYAYEPLSGWGIFSQTPASVIDRPIEELVKKMIYQALPFFILILLAAWFVSYRIAKPLHLLARFSKEFSFHNGEITTPILHLRSGIYEVQHLHRGTIRAMKKIKSHIRELNIEIQSDGLTGLANRRTFDLVVQEWISDETPFSVILLDIDHFKQVNDAYGHMTGDEVLQFLAQTMLELCREGDLCFRYGGEEFAILVSYGSIAEAHVIGERLRKTLMSMKSPTGEYITVSSGIAAYPEHGHSMKELISHADQALYESKRKGRNQITVYSNN